MKKFLRILRQCQADRDIEHAERRVARLKCEIADLQAEKRAADEHLIDLKLFVRSI